ncbi:signal transduction histidine-protein kinase BarA [Clostridium aceticum]|uniref:Circadian input-output histidine kinase CikA n=1 Tax=Clostridium aceticum TaxID=84022 RepID=A0A0G3WEX7_9CLOT|nr:response regulator [Clostridium aceticum]AKL97216.1 signal transduction histidine-protein kinase BarA [Clostridium aceticum]
MELLKNLKIRTKISVGFGLVLIVLVVSILFQWLGLNRLNKDFSKYREIATQEVLAGRVQANFFKTHIAFKNFIRLEEASQEKVFQENFLKMEGFISELNSKIDHEERRESIETIARLAKEYKENFNKVVAYKAERQQIFQVLASKGPEIEKNLSKMMEVAYNSQEEDKIYGGSKALNHLMLARLEIYSFLRDYDRTRVEKVKNELLEMDQWIKFTEDVFHTSGDKALIEAIKEDKEMYLNSFIQISEVVEETNATIGYLHEIGPEIANLAENIKLSIIEEQDIYGPKVKRDNQRALIRLGFLSALGLIISVIVSIAIVKIVTFPVNTVTSTFKDISEGEADLKVRLEVESTDELGEMAKYFNRFMEKLQKIMNENKDQNWIKTGQAELNEKMRGQEDMATLSHNILSYVATYLKAQIGAIYIKNGEDTYRLLGSFAYKKRKNLSNEFKLGEGIIGQSAVEKQVFIISNVPDDYIKINSGVGEAVPKNIVVVPCLLDKEVKCLIELGSFHEFTEIQIEFLNQISQNIAINIHAIEARIRMEELLDRMTAQSEELKVQQEELRQSNRELEEQTQALKESEAQLQSQQEELRVINEELVEHTKNLELQKSDIDKKNQYLVNAQSEIQEKAKALEIANKYKTEFLANMSHELRTPLNSILVLSQLLAEKKDRTPLTEKQLEFAGTIHAAGSELLRLINDVLDLSKVEAGQVDINLEDIKLRDLAESMEKSFREIANSRNLDFHVLVDQEVPETIFTDVHKLQQILNNLLSNAFKFTEEGSVTLKISCSEKEFLSSAETSLKNPVIISVEDTGIGISPEKHTVIFEAFKQADGTTSRRYGGTGLGLSITKELVKVLGGKIHIKSQEGEGSTFTLILPIVPGEKIDYEEVATSREDKCDLSHQVEDLENFKRLLVVGMDRAESYKIVKTLEKKDRVISSVETGMEAINLLKTQEIHCMILDVKLKDMSGFEFLEKLKVQEIVEIPIIVYTEKSLTLDEETLLHQYVESIIIKGARSTERLIGEIDLFLSNLKERREHKSQKTIRTNEEKEETLIGRKILIVDDDMRNVFTLSNMLEEKGMEVIVGRNGKEGVDKLQENADIDLILMDIMMPEMDGYTAIEKIRRDKKFFKIPIIALTAKSMREDRQKCIEAGANDYLTKPIETNKLLSLLRVWLYR